MTMVNDNPILHLKDYGQSVWMDNLSRDLLVSGELVQLMDSRDVHGITSNPAIFEKAIALGPIQHELLVEQSFFYTDIHKTLYEIKLKNDSTQPLKLDCDYPIYG